MQNILKDQIAIITGASDGIGAGCAIKLAEAGATVVINYPRASSKDKSEKIVSDITSAGGNAISFQCDVGVESEVIAMFKTIIEKFGTVDILVNNAGIQRDAKLVDMTLDQWNGVLNTNLTGQFLCAREAIKEFLRRGVTPKS